VDFAIRVVRAEQATTLAVTGEVDLSTAGELAEAGVAALAAGAAVVIVDLSGVTFLDSTGLAALVTINNQARNGGATLIIARPRARVRHLFRITGLDMAFTITDGGLA
jgi:anti-sigma B factor antagonist